MHPDTLDAITAAADGPADPAEIGRPPRGYNPAAVTEPPEVDHSADEAAASAADLARLTISDVATDLTMLRMQQDAGDLTGKNLDGALARAARTLRALAAVLALAFVAAVAVPSAPAQAAETPQPDPISVSVTLTAGAVRVAVPVAAVSATPAGWHCASVWGPTSYGRGFVGRACSRTVRFVVRVSLDSRFVPVGRSTMAVTDDVDPLGTYPQVVNLTARRPSRFGLGVWTPTPFGDGLTVYAPLYAYTPAVGDWTPQQSSPVRVEELVAGRWALRATLWTNRQGAALGTVVVGCGPHTMRVRRLQGAGVEATTGTARTFYLVPADVPDGTI